MTGRSREWWIRGILALCVPLLLIGFVELVLRVAGTGYNPAFWVPVAGRSAVATNDDFGLRFFPRSLARTPAPQKVLMPKPAQVKRLFVLGESAAMGFPDPAVGLAPMLELMLNAAQPDVRWEVHNAAMTAINSHVILPVARECARLSPDMFVVLAGNNEAVGPFGPATVFGQTGAPVWLARASIYLRATRLGQALGRLVSREAPAEWRGLEMFHQRLPHSDARLPRMYDAFRKNLTDIVRTGRNAGAAVMVVTVPVNLSDSPPFASAGADNAEAEYRSAHELLASGKPEAALQRFRRARDFDALRFRADSKINEIIREIAMREHARLVDAEQNFGLAGNDLFWEHVHFTPEGTYRLASIVSKELGAENPPSFDEVRTRLPITTWDERNLRSQIAALLRRPPFAGQSGYATRLAELQTTAIIDPKVRGEFEKAVAERPDDTDLLGRYASLLRDLGEPAAAAEVLAQMLDVLPGRKAWHASRGAALSDAGRQDAALAEFQKALAIDSQFDPAHFGLGLVSARTGRQQDAVQHYEEALRLNPAYAEAAYNLAGSFGALGREDDARRQLERALAVRPDFARAHAALAQLHAKHGRIEEAIRSYQQAIRGEPPLAEAHYDLGVLLARQGRLAEAVGHYKRATELRPDYPEALNNLGIALAKQGDTVHAADAFERALAIQPSFEAARANLLRIRRNIGSR